jgi:preprotein translocase subunit SecD
MQRQRSLLALIFVLLMAAIAVIVTIPVPLGLDLRGGSQLTIQVQSALLMREITERDLAGVQKVV